MTTLTEQAKAAGFLSKDYDEPPMTYSEHARMLEQTRQEYARQIDFQTENRRQNALSAAIQFTSGAKEPEKAVAAAKVFYDFLRGAE